MERVVEEIVSEDQKSQVRGCYIINLKATTEQIRDYFSFLEKEVCDHVGFYIRFGEHTLKLTFPTEEYAKMYESSLQYVKTEPVENPDGKIHIWSGSFQKYLPMKSKQDGIKWTYEGATGNIRAWNYGRRLTAHDYVTNTQYIVVENQLEDYTPPWHPFRYEFHNFAERNGYLLLHGAVVGIDDKGVLISATGGSGKSTTVLGCLLDGFSYVCDDYLIMNRETTHAYPLYSCGILNGDSLERLPELKEYIKGWVPDRENRAILDLHFYSSQFVRGMKVKALVRPSIPDVSQVREDAACIVPDTMQGGKMQMAISTARQNGTGLLKDSHFIYQVMDSVKELPSYEFRLSFSREENTELLKNFIQTIL